MIKLNHLVQASNAYSSAKAWFFMLTTKIWPRREYFGQVHWPWIFMKEIVCRWITLLFFSWEKMWWSTVHLGKIPRHFVDIWWTSSVWSWRIIRNLNICKFLVCIILHLLLLWCVLLVRSLLKPTKIISSVIFLRNFEVCDVSVALCRILPDSIRLKLRLVFCILLTHLGLCATLPLYFPLKLRFIKKV